MRMSHPFERSVTPSRSVISRRGFLGGAAALAAAPLLAACGSSGGAASTTPAGTTTTGATGTGGAAGATSAPTTSLATGDKVLTIATNGMSDALLQFIQTNGADPIGAKLQLLVIKNFPADIVSAQQAGNSPDIVQYPSDSAATLLNAGVKLDALNDRLAGVDQTDFYPQDSQAGTIKGNVYALAWGPGTRVIVYRKDYAANNGPVPDSWTPDEFGAWAAHMNASGRYTFGWETKTGDGRAASNIQPLLWSAGGALVTGDPGSYQLGFTADQVQKVMQFYYDMINKYKIAPKDVAGWGYQDTDGGFAKGTLAAFSTGPFVRSQVAQVPDVYNNLGTAPIPNLGTPKTYWESQSWMMHSDSQKKDLVWQFIQQTRTTEYQTAQLARQNNGWLSVRRSLNATIGDKDPFIGFFAKTLEYAQVAAPIAVQPWMDKLFFPAMQEIALKGSTPDQVTATLMKSAPDVLADTNAGS